jgi:glutamate-5-semialdehyde dehydrogenase
MSESALRDQAARVNAAARVLSRQSSLVKDDALRHVAASIRASQGPILDANREDVNRARENGRDDAFVDRLKLTPDRIESMASAIEEIIALDDPVGKVDSMWKRPNGLQVGRKRIPLGVIGIIYEARPNVTSDAAALCLKSGNGVLLKGGSDAIGSNRAVYQAMRKGLEKSQLPASASDALGFIDTTDRDAVREMLTLDEHIDVIIPRGGKGLIRFVSEHSRIPVIKHDEGVCHVLVDGSASAEMADDIVLNSKTQRTSVCNAAETILFTRSAVEPHLDRILRKLADAGVFLHLCPTSLEVAQKAGIDAAKYERASEDAYGREYLALEVAIRVVDDLERAVAHIDQYGSRHTEAVVTNDYDVAQAFVEKVDSSCVMVNASTRFADGNQLGLGAEIGISTTRMHAYGPMGIKELTTTKFVVFGSGQTRT